jgi:hypothetical protein
MHSGICLEEEGEEGEEFKDDERGILFNLGFMLLCTTTID